MAVASCDWPQPRLAAGLHRTTATKGNHNKSESEMFGRMWPSAQDGTADMMLTTAEWGWAAGLVFASIRQHWPSDFIHPKSIAASGGIYLGVVLVA
jgi:hypothetical protein